MAHPLSRTPSNFFESEIEHLLSEEDDRDSKRTSQEAASPHYESSSKMIESLYEKIDNLTNTNLKLTVQSRELLDRLEALNNKEVKSREYISAYSSESENLNIMLQRKVRKIKDLDNKINELKSTYEKAKIENDTLMETYNHSHGNEKTIKDNINKFKTQYDYELNNFKLQKDEFLNKIDLLNDLIDKAKVNTSTKLHNNGILRPTTEQSHYSTLKDIPNKTNIIDEKIQSAIDLLDFNSWVELYNLSERILLQYTENNMNENDDMVLPKQLQILFNEMQIETPDLQPSKTRRKPTSSISARLNMLKTPNGASNIKNYYSATQNSLPGVKFNVSESVPGTKRVSSSSSSPSSTDNPTSSRRTIHRVQQRKRNSVIHY
ncbi:hypothetical protein KAFR_0H00740 [Kazachstania africana CBS 2517]|uniref:SWI5-dependent HO expression protein 3 n=1 Tax=Kazachstania africana (strain ATCC 22294 / BCRC 22015 / CBS 2517 / CECT 1963 / NBRC 1671 / NRRL Y-8276) TaxID=1071382 RepID=H2AYS7_KAZAF|nr:hypothetical protein KAFR_0H00740 [Kazachstania africana CBS 2517]CCF59483.1 hypothetical protein KAFR_0H00740 [Kazachstania africana CBS 2517]